MNRGATGVDALALEAELALRCDRPAAAERRARAAAAERALSAARRAAAAARALSVPRRDAAARAAAPVRVGRAAAADDGAGRALRGRGTVGAGRACRAALGPPRRPRSPPRLPHPRSSGLRASAAAGAGARREVAGADRGVATGTSPPGTTGRCPPSRGHADHQGDDRDRPAARPTLPQRTRPRMHGVGAGARAFAPTLLAWPAAWPPSSPSTTSSSSSTQKPRKSAARTSWRASSRSSIARARSSRATTGASGRPRTRCASAATRTTTCSSSRAPPELLEQLNHALKITDGVNRFRIIKLRKGTPDAAGPQHVGRRGRRPSSRPRSSAESARLRGSLQQGCQVIRPTCEPSPGCAGATPRLGDPKDFVREGKEPSWRPPTSIASSSPGT